MTDQDAILKAIHQSRTGDSSTVAVRHLASQIRGKDISLGTYWVILGNLEEQGWISIDEGHEAVSSRGNRPRYYLTLRKELNDESAP